MTKRKSALIAFVVLAIAFGVVFSFDYTDTYVSDRFHKALKTKKYKPGEPFSLDAFLEYYDWDRVCVVPPYSQQEFDNIVGMEYHPAPVTDDGVWSLVFVNNEYVIAEIEIDRGLISIPTNLTLNCFDRWSAIISLEEPEDSPDLPLKMIFAHD